LTKNFSKWLVFLVVAAGVFMSTLDSSMVNIALPMIMREFHSPLHLTEWVVLVYLLAITATLLFWGHLSDRIGRKRIYASGMFIFAAGSLSCAMSSTLLQLIAFRFVQALGASMMMATGPAIIKEIFPAEQLGRALGLIGIAVSLGLMTGPSLGGLLLEFYTWRSIFYLTVPIGFFFMLLAVKQLPVTANAFRFKQIDWLGGLVWAFLLSTLAFTLSHITATAWSPLFITTSLTAALVGLLLFVRVELNTLYPVLPLKLLKERYFSIAVVCAVLSFIVLFTAIMLVPFYLDRVQRLSPSRIGIIMMAIPLAVFFIAPGAGWISDLIGRRIPTTSGLIISAVGSLLMTGLTPHTSPWRVAFNLALLGFGQALFLSPNSAAVLARIHDHHNGTSAAMLATARNLGMLLGIAMASLVFSVTFSKLTGGLDMKDFNASHSEAFMAALTSAFYAATFTGLFGALLSWLREPLTGQTRKQASSKR